MNDFTNVKDQYDRKALEYHNKLCSLDGYANNYIERPAIRKLISGLLKDKKVLDLGCGSGILTKELKEKGAQAVGIDLSKGLIDIAKKEFPGIDFRVGNAEKTPFKNGEFDLVVSSLVAHYFKDLLPFFEEVSRILKDNGSFVFSIHHPFAEALKKEYTDGKKRYYLDTYNDNNKFEFEMAGMKLTAYKHSFQTIFSALKESGFVVDELIEAIPIKEAIKIDQRSYYEDILKPNFLLIRAKKLI